MLNPVFQNGGPTFPYGGIFPFVFICIMCGSISGFHALVSSGTTPKMIDKEAAGAARSATGRCSWRAWSASSP